MRGRKAENLPQMTDVSADGTKIRCLLCIEHNSHSYSGAWMRRASFATHQKSGVHQSSEALEAARTLQVEAAQLNTSQIDNEQNAGDEYAIPHAIPVLSAVHDVALASRVSEAEQELWEDYVMNDTVFDAGEDLHNTDLQHRRDQFERSVEAFGLTGISEEFPDTIDPEDADQNLDATEHDDILSDILNSLALDDELALTDLNIGTPAAESLHTAANKSEWFPYGSKLVFLLDVIDNLPRLRISGSLMKVIIWLLRELRVKNVPTYDGLRLAQKKVYSAEDEAGVPTIHWTSPKGNAYSFNDVRTLVANDWANPLVCPHIRRYPVIPPDGVVSEVWHAAKWHNIDRHLASPMYNDGNQHFYIDEPARLRNGSLVIPIRWLEDTSGEIFADVWSVEMRPHNQGKATINDQDITRISAHDLQDNMLSLQDVDAIPAWCCLTIEAGHASRMPNPDRKLADGDPLYTSFIDIFGDDVSGNRSKSWNKHWNTYISHRSLPRKLLQQEYHTHFVSTSTHASIPEQFHGIKDIIESTHREPVKVRHAISGEQIRFKLYCNCGPGDNPAQSDVAGTIGGNGNFPCRKCTVGGTQKEKETVSGFHSMFYTADARSSAKILLEVETQVAAACLGVAQTVKDRQSDTGVKDSYTQSWIEHLIDRARMLQKASPTRATADIQVELLTWVNANKAAIYNSFLTLDGFDVARDTPVEILHTILLGIVKYLWHGSHTAWTAAQKKIYSIRLQGTVTSGLSIPAIRSSYIMQYANSLIGRQFKTLAQVNVFHVHDLVNSLRFDLTKAVGELTALLWFTEIRHLDEYLADVEIAASNVLDITALIDPSKIVSKIKYHLLPHIRQDILEFGPLVGVATETFECFNAIFRYCSILSNHLSPSRDIAYQLAHQESVKHILSGGWWADKAGSWHQGSRAVRGFMRKNRMIQALYGCAQNTAAIPGTVKREPRKRDPITKKLQPYAHLPWHATQAAVALNTVLRDPSLLWNRCTSVVSAAQDECKLGSWVVAQSPLVNSESDSSPAAITGQILEILTPSGGQSSGSFVVLDVYQISALRHELFGMPVLSRRFGEKEILILSATDISFQYNVQHDCPYAKCAATGTRPQIQERINSGITETFIVHQPIDRFIINTHALHNAHLIRDVLPRSLTAPIPYCSDREEHHSQIAVGLRTSQTAKRTLAAAKAAQKKASNAGGGSSGVPMGAPLRKRKRVEVDSIASDERDKGPAVNT